MLQTGGMKNYGESLQNILKLEPNQQISKLIELVQDLIEENQRLRLENQQLRVEVHQLKDEIAHLKNLPPRPKIEPSKLEKETNTNGPKNRKENWSKGSKNQKLVIDEEIKVVVAPEEIPAGAKFKGYKEIIVQDLVIRKNVIKYRLEQWQMVDGSYVFAKLPSAADLGHFGPGVWQYIVHQYNANRVPQNRIRADLMDKGIEISAGQIDEILKTTAEQLFAEKESLLSAGLQAEQAQSDDTGGRHNGKNSVTTLICNDYFAYFKSCWHKSRINFLEILCQSKIEYLITQESLNYIEAFQLAPAIFACMQELLGTSFADCRAWEGFLQKKLFGKTARRVLTEGALIGTLMSRKTVTLETILMSDGAGQFNVFKHVLCWIHIERSIKRLVPINEQDRLERDLILDKFWTFYRALKAYKQAPSVILKQDLEKQFDEIFSFRATEIPLAQALKKIRDSKQQLLLVLDHPEIPLHNNASEGDIREFVTKRKVSGGTRSDAGRDARDTFISLYKTCKKLSISFWKYLWDRINKLGQILPLADIIGQRIKAANSSP